jgi:hypothetical protein
MPVRGDLSMSLATDSRWWRHLSLGPGGGRAPLGGNDEHGSSASRDRRLDEARENACDMPARAPAGKSFVISA